MLGLAYRILGSRADAEDAGRSAILKKNGQPALTISLVCNEAGLVSDIYITLNPDKLAHLEPVDIH